MRNFKKVLSLVLCMAMMLSVMVVGAGAAFKDQNQIKNTEAVDMCSALNIINGYTDGTFRPDGTITRAEACKMICIALNGGKEPVLGTNATATFTDIKGHWAESYIEYCVSEGIVAGVGGGKFNPNGNVTGSQFAKMLLIALGYRADHENFLGNAWEVNVNVKATQKGLYEDLEGMDPSVALTRDNAAQMVWNALQAKEVKYEYTLVTENGQLVSKVTVTDKDMETLLADKYGVIDDESAIMTGFSYDEDEAEWTYYFDKHSDNQDGSVNIAFGEFTSDVDYTDLFRMNVKVVYTVKNHKVDTVYGMFAYDSAVIAEGVLGDIDAADLNDKSIEIADVDYDTTGKAVVAYAFNADADSKAIDKDYKTPAVALGYSMKAIDNTGDNKIDVVVYVPFTVAEVTYVGTKSFTAGGTTYKFEDVNVYDGIAKEDWVVITDEDNAVDGTTTFEQVKEVSATAQAVKSDMIKFDGTWYDTTYTNAKKQTAQAGDDCDFVAVNGYLYNLDASGDLAGAEDLLVVTAAAKNTAGIDNTISAKILKADGSETTVEVAKVNGKAVTAGSVAEKIYTFEINDDGYYELKDSSTFSTSTLDYDVVKVGSLSFVKKDGDNAGYIMNGTTKYYIADNAVVFVKDSDGDFSVTTGAKLKATKTDMSVWFMAADKDDDIGYNMVQVAFVGSNNLGADTDNYAYVTADAAVMPDGDKYYVEIPVGDDSVLTTKSVADKNALLTAAKALEAGDVIKYTLNGDGKIDSIDAVYEMNALSASADAINATVAISAKDGNNIQFSNNFFTSKTAANTASAVTYDATLTDDTVIIYVDNAANTIEEGSIQLASDTVITDIDSNSHYYANAMVVTNDEEEVLLLIVDVNNDLLDLQ